MLFSPALVRPGVLLSVCMIRIEGRDLLTTIKEAFDNLDSLHEGVILVAYFVFPQPEPPA